VGGTVGTGHPESELLAGLLAYEARITLARTGGSTEQVELDALLDDRGLLDGAIITEVSIETAGRAAVARTGRTPADTSIVAVVGRNVDNDLRLGITGVAGRPVLVDRAQVDALNPPGDFRGSSEYRRHLARTLTLRVLEELGEQS
jgi:CO/xanthine dehydrogenase FAD-binding subunit